MKLSRGILLLLLGVLLGGTALSQSTPYFIVNGQSCEEGYCAINVVSYGVGRPLQLRMSGDYSGGALDLFLSFQLFFDRQCLYESQGSKTGIIIIENQDTFIIT